MWVDVWRSPPPSNSPSPKTQNFKLINVQTQAETGGLKYLCKDVHLMYWNKGICNKGLVGFFAKKMPTPQSVYHRSSASSCSDWLIWWQKSDGDTSQGKWPRQHHHVHRRQLVVSQTRVTSCVTVWLPLHLSHHSHVIFFLKMYVCKNTFHFMYMFWNVNSHSPQNTQCPCCAVWVMLFQGNKMMTSP